MRWLKGLQSSVSIPWLILACAMVALAWGNSLVPGTGSGSISMSVVEVVRGALDSVGLPSGWVTNFLIRKTAHFTEYAVMGAFMAQALDPHHRLDDRSFVAISLAMVLVPSIDETIQLFVDGRSGQVTDVLLDCCGAACGIGIRSLIVYLRRDARSR